MHWTHVSLLVAGPWFSYPGDCLGEVVSGGLLCYRFCNSGATVWWCLGRVGRECTHRMLSGQPSAHFCGALRIDSVVAFGLTIKRCSPPTDITIPYVWATNPHVGGDKRVPERLDN